MVFTSIQNCCPDCATLIGNHIVGMMSSVGLLPMWMQQEAFFDPESRSAEYFRTTYEIPNAKSKTSWQKIILTLQSSLENRIGRSFFSRLIENLLCKAYRSIGNNRTFHDVILLSQQVYSYDSNGIGITQRGYPKRVVKSLIERFAFGEDQLTMMETGGQELQMPMVS